MGLYDDSILSPKELEKSYMRRLYARINRGLSDSYERGFALLSNYWVMTPDGPTLLSAFNLYDLELVKEWLTETGYFIEPYLLKPWFKESKPDCEIYKVTWPNV